MKIRIKKNSAYQIMNLFTFLTCAGFTSIFILTFLAGFCEIYLTELFILNVIFIIVCALVWFISCELYIKATEREIYRKYGVKI